MAKLWLILAVVVGACFDGARSSLPSPSEANVRLYLTKKGLDYANQVMMSSIVSGVEGLRIPSVSITQSIFWQRIYLRLYNSRVKKVKLGSSSLSFGYGHIKLSLELSSVVLAGHYIYRGGVLGAGSGTYTVTLKRVSLTNYLSLGANSKGKPYVRNSDCTSEIDDIKSRFRGGSSVIINFLVKLVKTSVQRDVQGMICKSISKSINKRGRKLPNLYQDRFDVVQVPNTEIRFPILEQPSIQRGYVDFLIEGGIYSPTHTLNSLSSGRGVSHIRHFPSPYKMLSIVLSDRLFNLLAELYYKTGVIELDEMETDDFSQPLAVTIDLSRKPLINTNVSGSFLTLHLNGTVTMNSSSYEVDLFVIGEWVIEVKDRVISGKAKNLRFEVTHYAVNTPRDLRDIIVPTLFKSREEIAENVSTFMENMVPLPLIPKIKIVNERILYRKGYIVFESNLEALN